MVFIYRLFQEGETALMYAAANGRLLMAQYLVEAKADYTIKDKVLVNLILAFYPLKFILILFQEGETALLKAASKGYYDLVTYFMRDLRMDKEDQNKVSRETNFVTKS
jgi:hypothetical protein